MFKGRADGPRMGAVKRAKRRELFRNAAAALAGRGDDEAIAALEHGAERAGGYNPPQQAAP